EPRRFSLVHEVTPRVARRGGRWLARSPWRCRSSIGRRSEGVGSPSMPSCMASVAGHETSATPAGIALPWLCCRSGRLRLGGAAEHAEHVLQVAAVTVVLDLLGSIDAGDDLEGGLLAVVCGGGDGEDLHRGEPFGDAGDRERLATGEAELVGTFAFLEAEREDAHADEVAAVDSLEALANDRANAEKHGPLGGPVTAGARAVFETGEHDERDVLDLVAFEIG